MEGFLSKKSRGERTFGSKWLSDQNKSWTRRWFVLKDQTVTYYENLDLLTGLPVNQKGICVVEGCEISPVSNSSKKFIFALKHIESKETLLHVQADDARIMKIWIKALTAAASADYTPELDYQQCCGKMNLDPTMEHNAQEINRAYRKKALEIHPDKGGKLADFKELKAAFNHLMARLDTIDEGRKYEVLEYEAVVLKGPGGMGIVVVEELSKELRVKQVKPAVQVQSLSGSVLDGIMEGDELVSVAGVDVQKLPLIQVAQKLNDTRVPVGTTVALRFARKKVRADSITDNELGQNSAGPPGWDNIPGSDSHRHGTPSERSGHSHSKRQSETAELKADLDACLGELAHSSKENEDLRAQNEELKREVERFQSLFGEAIRQQKLLELQLEQDLVYSTVTPEQLQASMEDTAALADLISGQGALPVSEEVDAYLGEVGLGSQEADGDVTIASQRTAVAATAAFDKSGLLLKKWSMSGDSIVDKLSRFEQQVRRNEAQGEVSNGQGRASLREKREQERERLAEEAASSMFFLVKQAQPLRGASSFKGPKDEMQQGRPVDLSRAQSTPSRSDFAHASPLIAKIGSFRR
ncbi:hypothetical protein B484DRAFT_422924 [Ochromonadaceae sp. CCMP2298]|nr:hypothetical protein B484DRAFT_422924 [Ochromonadaceae sp. CCMP2298]|mmetsp:Transcript_27155/g.60089  ORF Transcript_27155/g.60089 Transcript_27155/m.60089 type:complete len:584 (+) Transcript_27155:83-1834(+)|eukprot:CAMPEP_0173284238 /NCGR_PEP_ID=MMETSP1143-20121109/7909_1 /TAXON_ID=483371 /ORGANISM="non described non described, Strain CCMP2298" /LENGTH=583 /DNA_ID=CAMNT_0014222187 /DNA_START=13 /DNA_END=1764 /DNA_ORIENTATION=+